MNTPGIVSSQALLSGIVLLDKRSYFTLRGHSSGTTNKWLECRRKESQNWLYESGKPIKELELDQELDGWMISTVSVGHALEYSLEIFR